VRVGIGYDAHQLVVDRPLVIGGVLIEHDRGLEGHSDADVLVHAIIDALLGAAALGTIGEHFPDDDPQYEGISSLELLAMAMHKTNIWIDTSGWAPKYIPAEVIRELRTRLQDQFLFGSDYPFIKPVRVLEELDALSLKPEAKVKIWRENAARLLKLELR